jgi:uncharacterized membrane protein YkoI
LVVGCSSQLGIKESETQILLSDVPPQVLAAARTALPGIELSSPELEEENGDLVFELGGILDGKEYEIEISPDGQVLDVEEE